MDKTSTIFDLEAGKLSVLLKIGFKSHCSPSGSPNGMETLWSDCLEKPLPWEVSEEPELPVALTDYCQRLGLLSQTTIGGLFENSRTELAVIKGIKKYAKQRSAKSGSKEDRMIANTLYYVAIAHALVYHNRRITSFGYKNLIQKFQRLCEFVWLDRYTLGLFEKAWKQCQAKRQ